MGFQTFASRSKPNIHQITIFMFCWKTVCLTGCLMAVGALAGIAQNLQITNAEIKNNRIVVYYDLTDSIPDRMYSVRIYASADGYINPLQKVAGDVGLTVKTGLNRKVEVDAASEWDKGISGPLAFELRARVFVPFINTESINQYKVFKRSHAYNLTWSGGSSQNVLNFDLYKGEKKIASFPNIGNAGHHTIELPSYVKPGAGYRFRISDSKNSDEVVYTSEFRVRRKTPLLLKSLAIGAAGAAVMMLGSGSSGSDATLPSAGGISLPNH